MYGTYDFQKIKCFVHIIAFMKPKNLISQHKYIIYNVNQAAQFQIYSQCCILRTIIPSQNYLEILEVSRTNNLHCLRL